MRHLIVAGLLCAGCTPSESPAKLKAEAEAARQETERVRAEAEVARLKANAGIRSDKSFLRSPLEGRWVSTRVASHKFEFFPDGTYQEETLFATFDGTFAMLDGGRVKLVSKGTFGDSARAMAWSIEGDTLALETPLGPLHFKRK